MSDPASGKPAYTNPWADIASSRMAANKFWTPDLSLDLMGRDWGSLLIPCHMLAPLSPNYHTFSASSTTPTKLNEPQLGIGWPAIAIQDGQYADFEYTVVLYFHLSNEFLTASRVHFALGDDTTSPWSEGADGVDFNEIDSDDTPHSPGGFALWRIFRGGLPQGVQKYHIWGYIEGSGTGSYQVEGHVNQSTGTGTDGFPGPSSRIEVST